MAFDTVAFHPADLLLPASFVNPETWACVACDQYTSEPAYWQKAEALVGNTPSALRLILPECYLADSAARVPLIHAAMADALQKGVLETAVQGGFLLCERTTPSGTRVGLLGAVDLEAYSYTPGSLPLVRPTEKTIPSRLPPRLVIRRGAPVELSHIMILIDDPGRTVIEPLRARKSSLRKLYDFELMMGGGHLTGYAADGQEELRHVDQSLNALLSQALKGTPQPMLLAVGDGNHSLATAKAYWEELKPRLSENEQAVHPARYALCEIINLHDPSLCFEPIHRVLTGVKAEEFLDDWRRYAADRSMTLSEPAGTLQPEAHTFRMIAAEKEQVISVTCPEGAIPCETLQKFLDDYLRRHPGTEIDFIHGEASLRSLAQKPDTVGFLLPEIDKNTFFADVRRLGVLPRKTFSMGEADEKRFYMEARRIL